MTTPNHSLPVLAATTSEKISVNQITAYLDSLNVVIPDARVNLNTPLGSETDGSITLVGNAPTGALVGFANQAIYYTGGGFIGLGTAGVYPTESGLFSQSGTAWTAYLTGRGGGAVEFPSQYELLLDSQINILSPSSTAEGTINLISGEGTATGDFAGQEGNVAYRQGGAWNFFSGSRRIVETVLGPYRYEDSGSASVPNVWVPSGGSIQRIESNGATNRVSVPFRWSGGLVNDGVVGFDVDPEVGDTVGMSGSLQIYWGDGTDWNSSRIEITTALDNGGSVSLPAGVQQVVAFDLIANTQGVGNFSFTWFNSGTLTGTAGSVGDLSISFDAPFFYIENRIGQDIALTIDLMLTVENV